MSKRKFSKKEVAISIAAAALAIATVGGAVAIHKDSSNSNTGHSITVEQSDYSKKKEEAIQQIEDAVKDLSDDQQSEIDSYIKQNIENIQKAESERTIESTLQETLDYIDQRSLSEKEEQRKETQTTETSSSSEREVTSSSVSEEDKYHILGEDYIYENNDYLPVINQSTAAFSTLTHEFGHALAHGSVEGSLNTNLHQKEFEADVMSIMFCQHYGLEITDERKSHLSGHYKDWKKSDPNNFHPDKSMRKMFDLFREHSTVLDQKIVKAFPELATRLLPQELEVNSEKKKVVNKTAKRKPKKKKTPRL